jgi:hypothetical protein
MSVAAAAAEAGPDDVSTRGPPGNLEAVEVRDDTALGDLLMFSASESWSADAPPPASITARRRFRYLSSLFGANRGAVDLNMAP